MFTPLKERTPEGFLWSGRKLKAAQKKEKQERTNEKPKLDNARRFRGICFIDPEDGE